MTAVTSASVHNGLMTLSTLLSIKIINFFLFESITFLNRFTPVTNFWGTLTAGLGWFFNPLYYFVVYPFTTAGAYSRFSYSDLMAVVLFGLVGTTFSPTNVFCQWMFFYLPAIFAISSFTNSLILDFISLTTLIQSSTSIINLIYYTSYSLLTLVISTAYTAGPLIISTQVFYPGTL